MEREQRNYEILSKTGKWIYKFGAVNLKGNCSKVRWLHPLGFLYNVVVGILIPFHCMISNEKIQDQYPEYFGKHTILF